MTVHRIVGTETEYGISVIGDPTASPMAASTRTVLGYRSSIHGLEKWDYAEETPLRDARGFELARQIADPDQLTDELMGLANLILPNGARLYVDHAHPEYSAPECTNPRDAVIWEKAGDLIMNTAIKAAGLPAIALYKNNTDNKGASYGFHENYLVPRATDFNQLSQQLIPFFISRQVICGAGRVGLGQDGRTPGFQISQRADFFEVEIGLETTVKRPIINTRDEPHADPAKWRRLHVIIGDANMSEISSYLKLGTTSLVLAMVEAGYLDPEIRVNNPVQTLHRISHDPSLQQKIELTDGRKFTAIELQQYYCAQASNFLATQQPDPASAELLTLWNSVLAKLSQDIFSCADQLDWVAKYQLLRQYQQRDNLDWAAAKLQLIDLQYSDIRPEKGIYYRLVNLGKMQRLVTDAEILAAVNQPPTDTRAWFRGACIEKFGAEIAAASWDALVFDLPNRGALQRVPTMDPYRGTKAHVGDLLAACESAQELVHRLGN